MKFDMHCHTKEGSIDAKVDIETYIKTLISKGFDGMLVTDHNSYRGYEKWKQIADTVKTSRPFTVLKGIEYDTRDGGHIIAILPEDVQCKLLEIRGMTVRQLEKIVHQLGGILGPAHSFDTGYYALMNTRAEKKDHQLIHKFDFIETFNACAKPLANAKARLLAIHYQKPHFAGSDAHKMHIIGNAFTSFDTTIRTNDDLIKAVKAKATTFTGGDVFATMEKKVNIILEKLGIVGYWIYNRLGAFVNGHRRKRELRKFHIHFAHK